MTSAARRRPPAVRPAERGGLLLGVLTTILVLGILSGVAVQDWSIIERREREAQLIFVQEQYAAAIIAYQKAQGALPTELKQLTEPGEGGEHVLRRPWTDPLIRGAALEDWCLLRLGAGGQTVSTCEGAPGSATEGEAPADDETTAPAPTPRRGKSAAGASATTGGPASAGAAAAGLAPGGIGLVGVHSKSSERAYNTAKRGAEVYREWRYTIEDYQREMAARALPGMNAPGAPPPKPGQPGGADASRPPRLGGRTPVTPRNSGSTR